MDYYKIQIKILKAALNKSNDYRFGRFNDSIAVIDRGIRILLVPDNQFFLSYDRVRNEIAELSSVKQMLQDDTSFYGNLTGDIKVINKKSYLKIASGKTEVWVDKDFLIEFDKDCAFKISDFNKPIFVYEKNIMVGMLLPYNTRR